MSHTSNPVIIGWSHHNTYSMIRCFGENNIRPDIILCGKQDSYILLSKFVNNRYVVPDAETALIVLKEKYTQAVVIACADDIASLMDKEFENLRKRFKFFNCGSTGKLTQYMDKMAQSAVASQVGLKVPTSIDAKPDEIDPKYLPFPCIIKPLESVHGGKNIQICRSETEVSAVLNTFDVESKVMIQQYVEKDYEVVVLGLSYNGVIIIPAFIHKHRDTKGGTTYATVKPISALPTNVLTSCKQFVEKISYQGLFGIELICKDEDYYFIEINLRNDATTYAIAIAGCNLPLAYWKLANGKSANEIVTRSIQQINSMVEFNDFLHVLKRKVSIMTWLKQKKDAQCKYCYCKADMQSYKKQRKDFLKFIYKQTIHIFP